MNINTRIILPGLLFVSLAFSGGLNKHEKKIQLYVEKNTEEAIALLEKVVNINSGTLNIEGNKTVGKVFQAELDHLGFNTYWVTYPKTIKRSGHLFAEMRGGKGKKLLWLVIWIQCLSLILHSKNLQGMEILLMDQVSLI